MIIVHSFMPPAFYDSNIEPGIRYMVADGKHSIVPSETGWKDIMWFKRPYPGGKAEALKIQAEWEVDGSKGKKYTIKSDNNRWSCSCPAFGWNRRTCKHIDKLRKENGWQAEL